VSRLKTKIEVHKPRSRGADLSDQAQLSDTYTSHDYEVILDVLYGLFSRESAGKVRVFDPFVADALQAPLVTPRMLTERLEAMLGEYASA
jgi:hypothetical protein